MPQIPGQQGRQCCHNKTMCCLLHGSSLWLEQDTTNTNSNGVMKHLASRVKDEKTNNQRCFCLPAKLSDTNNTTGKENNCFVSHLICKAALGHVLDFCDGKWCAVKQALNKGMAALTHGNTNKPLPSKQSFDDTIEGNLVAFMEFLKDTNCGAPSSGQLKLSGKRQGRA